MTRDGRIEALVCSLFTVSLLLFIVARDYPLTGHDHRYYIPRLIDTELHVRNNGYLAVQWYTPTFGGGLPAFPNPQHLQHSILQILTAFVNPWRAILIATAIASFLGFFAFRRFLQERLEVAATPSTFGAVLFIANGFYIEHLIVGHVGYQLFPLGAVILYALTDTSERVLRNGALIALVVAALLFHAGIYQIILIGMSVLLVLPLLSLIGVAVSLRRVVAVAAVASLLTAALTAAKVHAVLAFMRLFPREIAAVYDASLPQALAGFALQLLGAMTVAPLMPLAGVDPSRLAGAMSKLIGANVQIGMWEIDTSLSPALWIVLGVACVAAVSQLHRSGLPQLTRTQKAAAAALAVVTWILLEATLARGVIYPLLKPLPILRSLHVNSRIASAFIVPLIIIAVRVLHGWQLTSRMAVVSRGLLVLALISPLAYLLFPGRVHQRSFDVSGSVDAYEQMRSGERFEVTHIADVTDAEALALGASSYRPYEPLFGYGLEAFAADIVPGDVRQVRDGAFNMTNPTSLVFPQENGVMPFQRLPADDEENLNAFVTRGPIVWRLPAVQPWLNNLSVVAFLFATVAVIWPWAASVSRHG